MSVLHTMKDGDRPATINDLARRFGLNAKIVSACARQMVDAGAAEPSMIDVRGVATLHGLLPKQTAAAVSAPTVEQVSESDFLAPTP